MATTSQHFPLEPKTASRRSGFVMDADHVALQTWVAFQNPPMASRRLAAKLLPSLKDVPYTASDWKRALAEVKRDYSTKRYRPCAARCTELLGNVAARVNIQPAYLIYLHFYAATSLEMLARSLHAGSPYRIKLLEEAREHYDLASQISKTADEQASHVILRPISPSSGLPSPIESCLSNLSFSTRMTSPTPSAASTDGLRTKRKKKVAFADELEYEPVRPDSPTLGLSDPASGRTSPCQDVPSEPLPPSVQTMPNDCPASSPSPSLDGDEFPRHMADAQLPESRESLGRYCAVLSSIQRQITCHVDTIDREIAAALTPKSTVPVNEELRALELHSRIERLRANGWQRKRFDARRYEAFRERVLADMIC